MSAVASTFHPEISPASIRFNAFIGRSYDHKRKEWRSASLLETALRALFSVYSFIDSIETACLKRSWKAVTKLDILPEKITQDIDQHFVDSRMTKHPLHPVAESISRIFARMHQEKNGKTFLIKENPNYSIFEIKNDKKETIGTMVRHGFGKWDLYAGAEKKFICHNDDVSEATEENKDVAHVKEVTYYSKNDDYQSDYYWPGIRRVQYSVFEGDYPAPSFTFEKEGDEISFVARDALTRQIQAVALWQRGKLQEWSVMLTNPSYWGKDLSNYSAFQQKESKLDFLMCALLKHSQKHIWAGDYERESYISHYNPKVHI